MGKGKFLYHIYALAVTAVWGTTFISSKILINAGFSPCGVFVLRSLIAYLCMWTLLTAKHRNGHSKFWANNVKDEFYFLLLGISGGSLYFLAENTAVSYTQTSHVSFIVGSVPLITALVTIVVKRYFKGRIASGLEDVRFSWNLLVGTILCMGGMAMIIFEGANASADAVSAPHPVLGDLLALLSAVWWALYSILAGQLTTEYGSLFTTRKVFFWGLVTIIPFVLYDVSTTATISGGSTWGLLQDGSASLGSLLCNGRILFNLFFLGLLASFIGYVVWNRVMAALGNVTSTNYIYLNPFFTLVVAVIVLGEKLTIVGTLGSLAIIGGVILAGGKKIESKI